MPTLPQGRTLSDDARGVCGCRAGSAASLPRWLRAHPAATHVDACLSHARARRGGCDCGARCRQTRAIAPRLAFVSACTLRGASTRFHAGTVGCRRILRRRPDRPSAVRGGGRSVLDLHALRGRNVAGSSAGPVIAGSRHAIVEAPQILVAPLHAQARQRRLAVGARGQTSRVGIRLFAGGGGARRTSATLRSGRTPGRRPCRWSGRAWRRCGVDRRRRNVPAPKRGADSARHRLVEMAALPVGTLVDRGLRRAIGTRRKQPHDCEQSLHSLFPAFPSVPAV